MIDTLAIIGVGLLGGSIALAARAGKIARHILGVSRDQQSLDYATRHGMIDEGYLEGKEDLSRAELALVCIPVDQIAATAIALLSKYPHLIVSDVGSTKEEIVQQVNDSGVGRRRFVGGHPLAGSEKSGPEHASATLFLHRLVCITPELGTAAASTELVRQFWQALGCSVVEVDPRQHDEIMAVTSHLPHVISHVLAGAIREDYLQYCGSGMKSMTRLAGSNPELWTAIAISNRVNLLSALRQFQSGVRELEQALQSGDEVRLLELLSQGKRTHHALGS